jgi:cysteine desulfurase
MVDHVYLDYAATTPMDSRVIEVMLPFFDVKFGNPSSIHSFGQQAEAAVEAGRESVAAGLNCNPDEIIFTSCGTEADNLALRGTALSMRSKTGAERILCSRAEHPAVSKTARQLQSNFGFQVDWLETDEYGMVLPEAVERAISADTAIVSVMYANNEIGTINPIREIAAICHRREVPFHTDAVQAAAYLALDVQNLGVGPDVTGA